jgi:hypothetical protein
LSDVVLCDIMSKARALYEFPGPNQGDLPFQKGDVIHILRKIDHGWWEGELRGKIGIFPANFVEEIPSSTPPAAKVTGAGTPGH